MNRILKRLGALCLGLGVLLLPELEFSVEGRKVKKEKEVYKSIKDDLIAERIGAGGERTQITGGDEKAAAKRPNKLIKSLKQKQRPRPYNNIKEKIKHGVYKRP